MSDAKKVEDPSRKDMDAILDAALDELDDEEEENNEQNESAKPAEQASPKDSAKTPPATEKEDNGDEALSQLMNEIMVGKEGEEALGAIMETLQAHLESEIKQSNPEKAKRKTPESTNGDVDRTISKLLEDMASAPQQGPPSSDEQAMMDDMMKEFEKMSGNLSADDMIDGMMEQLLAKELMYEPMKQVAHKFPGWLESNKGVIGEEEYKTRCKQYQCFKKMLSVYDTEPANSEKLMMLMQEVQEYGQPPPEIVKEIAPGLELDSDGVPKFGGMMGAMGNGENGDCRIM